MKIERIWNEFYILKYFLPAIYLIKYDRGI